jgi:hypothetical protein
MDMNHFKNMIAESVLKEKVVASFVSQDEFDKYMAQAKKSANITINI